MITLNKDSKNVVHFRKWCESQKKRYDVISGVRINDWYSQKENLTPYAYYTLYHWRPSPHHFDTTGPIGCFLAHKNVWKVCVQKQENIWVFEEGVYAYNHENMFNILDREYKNMDLILGHTIHQFNIWKQRSLRKSQPIGDHLTSIDKIYYGTKCYRVSPRFATLLLQKSRQFELHVDAYINLMAMYYEDQLQVCRTKYNIVSACTSWTINHSIDYSIFIPCISLLIIVILIIMKWTQYSKYQVCTRKLDQYVNQNCEMTKSD